MSKNAFYFYMLEFRKNQKDLGISYKNMSEVALAAGPAWKDASPETRRKYQDMVMKEKQMRNASGSKKTSTGITLAELERRKKEQIDAEKAERQDIINIIKEKIANGEIAHENFFLVDVNYFCQLSSHNYIIGESIVLQFNLTEGMKYKYHEIINPGPIPVGYTSDVKIGSKDIGLEMPDERLPMSNYTMILGNFIKLLKQNDLNLKTVPPLYTMPNKVAPVKNFIHQMCYAAGEDRNKFRVYKLDTLLFTLANALRVDDSEGFPKERAATVRLERELLMFAPGLACEAHDAADRTLECSESRVKRWAYTVMDSCCPLLDIELLPGTHAPPDDDRGVKVEPYPPCCPNETNKGNKELPSSSASSSKTNKESKEFSGSSASSSKNAAQVKFSDESHYFSSDSSSSTDNGRNPENTSPPSQFAKTTITPEFLAALSRGRGEQVLTPEQLLNLYQAQVQSCMEYCSHHWDGSAKYQLQTLESIERRAKKLIGNDDLFCHKLKSLDHRRKVASVSVTFR